MGGNELNSLIITLGYLYGVGGACDIKIEWSINRNGALSAYIAVDNHSAAVKLEGRLLYNLDLLALLYARNNKGNMAGALILICKVIFSSGNRE